MVFACLAQQSDGQIPLHNFSAEVIGHVVVVLHQVPVLAGSDQHFDDATIGARLGIQRSRAGAHAATQIS
jgi:hypothetical protein